MTHDIEQFKQHRMNEKQGGLPTASSYFFEYS